MPDIDCAYLVDWLFEVGPDGAQGGPVEFREIAAWASLQGLSLRPWESTAISKMSKAYMSQYHKSQDAACPAPYTPQRLSEEQRDIVARKADSIFGQLRAKK